MKLGQGSRAIALGSLLSLGVTAVILLGWGLGHIPGVADFLAQYLDLVLIGIVVLSVAPVLVRVIALRRKARTES